MLAFTKLIKCIFFFIFQNKCAICLKVNFSLIILNERLKCFNTAFKALKPQGFTAGLK